MEGQQNWSQPPNQSMQQQIPSFLSMIPTVRSLECLAWQLFYGPSEVVFDENRWQECFQTFNALAMQSTSLIMMLCQKYEEKVTFEKVADAMISMFQLNQAHQQHVDGPNGSANPNPTKPAANDARSPFVSMHPSLRVTGGDRTQDPESFPFRGPLDTLVERKKSKKVYQTNSKENSHVANTIHQNQLSEDLQVDDEQIAWSLHLELNTKARQGKPKPRAKPRHRATLSQPTATDRVPESQSRRKQRRKHIRRSL